ncbi:MAG TPA: DUF3307 domain-containing protein [Verrucomicrobiae bacterium]|nr:DUF3307 domain-containing protein [Verrucomicrobiae bacterium]
MYPLSFVPFVLGHLTADYLLQPRAMALQKSAKGLKGFGWCTLHCAVYTLCICAFVQFWNPVFVALVYFTHYAVDRYSLATYWLRLIQGRDISAAHLDTTSAHREIDISFACLVYAVTDNTIHLITLWILMRMFA